MLAALAPALVAAALLAPTALPAQAHSTMSGNMASLEAGIVHDLNAIRADNGLPPLRLNARLSQAATEHTREMATDGYFKHTSFDGTPFWQRVTHYYAVTGYGYWSVGENLLWSSPDVDPEQALQWWMQSPPHRANILSKDWREIGIDAEYVSAAPGTYHGLDVTLVTVDFGVRHA